MWEYFKKEGWGYQRNCAGPLCWEMTVKAWNWLEWRSWKKVESLLTSVPLLGARKTRTGNATYKMAWSLKVIRNRMVGPLFNAWRIRESWEEKVTLVNSSGMRQVGHLIYCAIARSWAFWKAGSGGDEENLFRSMGKSERQSESVQLLHNWGYARMELFLFLFKSVDEVGGF